MIPDLRGATSAPEDAASASPQFFAAFTPSSARSPTLVDRTKLLDAAASIGTSGCVAAMPAPRPLRTLEALARAYRAAFRVSLVPQSAERIHGAMADLLTYCARTDVPVLPQAAIAHAQFETIHPFADGNGRTGRVLVHVLLHATGATRRMTVPVSAGLLTDTAAYFQALTAYRNGDPVPIVARFTDAALDDVAARLGRRA